MNEIVSAFMGIIGTVIGVILNEVINRTGKVYIDVRKMNCSVSKLHDSLASTKKNEQEIKHNVSAHLFICIYNNKRCITSIEEFILTFKKEKKSIIIKSDKFLNMNPGETRFGDINGNDHFLFEKKEEIKPCDIKFQYRNINSKNMKNIKIDDVGIILQ